MVFSFRSMNKVAKNSVLWGFPLKSFTFEADKVKILFDFVLPSSPPFCNSFDKRILTMALKTSDVVNSLMNSDSEDFESETASSEDSYNPDETEIDHETSEGSDFEVDTSQTER